MRSGRKAQSDRQRGNCITTSRESLRSGGATFIARRHADSTHDTRGRRAARTATSSRPPSQYTLPTHQPGEPHLRLVSMVVSVHLHGALGTEAQTLIRKIADLCPVRGGGQCALPVAGWRELGHAGLRFPLPLSSHLHGAPGAGCRHLSTCTAAEAASHCGALCVTHSPHPAGCFDCPVDQACWSVIWVL